MGVLGEGEKFGVHGIAKGAPTRSVPDRGRFAIAQTWFRVERSQKPR